MLNIPQHQGNRSQNYNEVKVVQIKATVAALSYKQVGKTDFCNLSYALGPHLKVKIYLATAENILS